MQGNSLCFFNASLISQIGPCRNLQSRIANKHKQTNKQKTKTNKVQEKPDIPSQRPGKGWHNNRKCFLVISAHLQTDTNDLPIPTGRSKWCSA